MSMAQADQQAVRTPLRLWPGVIAAALIVLFRFIAPIFVADAAGLAVMTGLAGTVIILLWWMFFSRAPWSERIGAVLLMAIAVVGTWPFLDKSIAGGMMGRMFFVIAVPTFLGPAFVAWAVLTRRLSVARRSALLVVTVLFACGVWTLLRTDGVIGGAGSQLAWRWSETAEDRLLAQGDDDPPPPPAVSAPVEPSRDAVPAEAAVNAAGAAPAKPAGSSTATPKADTPEPAATVPVTKSVDPTTVGSRLEWPGFRGPRRDGAVRGVRIKSDWAASPPARLWRRPIGPGWSSFAVHGDRLYTQEQRGDDEMVASYKVSTGEPVWRHRDPVRFWESNGGAGPRGTPTLSNGRVYAFGATGILNALDARTGARIWSRNVASDLERAVPGWGFTSSPLVIDDIVVVAASGTLTGYDTATGKPRWVAPRQLGSYSSPHLATIAGVTQILLLSGSGVASIAPADGTLLWEHSWPGGTTIIQPAVTDDGDILINAVTMMGGTGIRRLAVEHGTGGWSVEERWTSNGLKPYFNDFVVHKGHAFGFDGSILSCIDLSDGTRKWKGGRYGHGQMVLLAEQDLLLVLSEEGELALVSATTDQYRELARVPAIEGKTWNHPALVGDILLLRNGEEMAAFRLAMESR
jgi:outer membrane protein assembly factor BamB